MAKNKEEEVLKIPVMLDGFKYSKMSGDWDIAFKLQPENLAKGKPLMDFMGDHFVMVLVRVSSKEAMESALGEEIKL